ncbi:MAG: type II secretion system protein [Candidatus Magasanikiibacteriota bacterium]
MKKTKNYGFTLLEVLVAMGIFILVAMSASWFIIHGFRYNAIVWEQLDKQNEGRKVLQQVVDTVRKAEESSVGGYPISTSTNYQLSVYANIDDDSYREKVRFWLDGITLKRGIIKPSGSPLNYSGTEQVVELAHDVVNISKNSPLFLYYDESYDGSGIALAQPVELTDVRVIRVQLELEKDPTATPVPLHVESVVSIRNLKTN